jgi:hypothetical protein
MWKLIGSPSNPTDIEEAKDEIFPLQDQRTFFISALDVRGGYF